MERSVRKRKKKKFFDDLEEEEITKSNHISTSTLEKLLEGS
jgi:hypothetical protein